MICFNTRLVIVSGTRVKLTFLGMCGRSYSPRFLYMWPNAKISVMGGQQAADVLTEVASQGKSWSAEQRNQYKQSVVKKFDDESSCYFSTAR